MIEQSDFPHDPAEWREAIAKDVGLSEEEGVARYHANTFPYAALIAWIEGPYSAEQGYSPDFVPALRRNVRGLVAWVYGESDEPDWQGRDEN